MTADEPATKPAPARRFLLSTAVPDVHAHPEVARPELADDVARIDRLFLGELGYRRGADLGLGPTREQLTKGLRAFATAPERAPDDYVVLYLACHGVTAERSGRHYLLLADSDARDLRGTALPTEDLVALLWEDTPVARLLVLIDACYAEEGADSALRAALEARRTHTSVTDPGSTGLVIIAASRRKEQAVAGALSAAFDRAVRSQATAGHVPVHIGIGQVMRAIRADPLVPPTQRANWSVTHAVADIPDFLSNPRYVPGASGLKLEEIDRIIDLAGRERRARTAELTGFFLPRARGTDVPTEEVWDFTGRHTALTDITDWLAPHRAADRLCVVTGDPGSGKSSLLGMVTVLTDAAHGAAVPRTGLPARLPEPGAVDVAVNASHKTKRQLLDALSAASGCAAASLGALAAHLQARSEPLVVLMDSLDEALDPHDTVEELIAPLIDPRRQLPLRLLVGARPHIARLLPVSASRIDLDDERHGDPQAVRAYTRKLLTTPGSVLCTAPPDRVDAIAHAIAEAAGRSFLVARITARTTARETRVPDPDDRRWRDELPRLPGEAMERDLEQRLGPLAGRARDLLRPLAFAQGVGLPWGGVWPRLATAISGRTYGDEDVVWLTQTAGSYVVESVEDDESVYRIYHRALVEYLREGRSARRVQGVVAGVLKDLDHAYVRRYLALHAAEGGVLDPLVEDADFVLTADPDQLLAALPRLRTAKGRRAGRAVRDVEELLRSRRVRAADPESRARLRLAAVCRKATGLAESCDRGDLPWRARWAAWNPHGGARRYEGLEAVPGSGIVVPLDDGAYFLERRPYWTGAVVWHLDTGDRTDRRGTDEFIIGATWTAPPQLRCCAVALSNYQFLEWIQGEMHTVHWRVLHVFDAAYGGYWCWRLHPHDLVDAGHERLGLRRPEHVQVWRDTEGQGPPTRVVLHFADGDCLIYTLGAKSSMSWANRRRRSRLSDFEKRRSEPLELQRRAEYAGHSRPGDERSGTAERITALAALPAEYGHKMLAGYSDATVRITDLDEFDPAVPTGHEGRILALAHVAGHAEGELVVTMGADGTVRLTSLTDRVPVRTLLERVPPPRTFAVHRVGRQWIVAVATSDGSLHRVDLDRGRPLGLPLRIGSNGRVRLATFRLGSVECVSVQGPGRGLQLYDLVTGDRVGGQEGLHEASAVCAVGGTTAVGGDDGVIRLWPGVHAADSTRIDAHEAPVLAVGAVHGPGAGSALVSVGRDHRIRCWDVVEQRELWRRPLPHAEPWTYSLVTCATVGRTREGHGLVVTGEIGGRVTVLTLPGGVPLEEREFTVPGIVTALTTGTVRGRDVVVAATASGRVACWDVTHGRWYGLGPEPEPPAWVTALALDPDGSGRLFAGADDGTVREWTVPACRPLGEPFLVHDAPVHALAFARGTRGAEAFSAGGDRRLVALCGAGKAWERRLPLPLRSLGEADGGGLLCGDERGTLWRLDERAEGWELTEALDSVPSATAVAALTVDGETAVAVGGSDGTVQVRDSDSGALLHQLRPACESAVVELMAASRPGPDGAPQPALFTRSELGVVEYWGLGGPAGARPPRTVLREVVLSGNGARSALARLPGAAPHDGDLALALDFRRYPSRMAVYDVDRGPLHGGLQFSGLQDLLAGGSAAVCCAGLWFLAVPTPSGLYLVDVGTWHRLLLPGRSAVRALAVLPGGSADALVLIGSYITSVVPVAPILAGLDGPSERVQRLNVRATHEYASPVSGVRHAVVLPGGQAYAAAARRELVVAAVHDGFVHTRVALPSVCTGLATGPRGELAVATRNGVILLDVPDTRP
ncbi:caspase family protein [Streptomyces sp. KL118A]|uniref:caspase family protein n=1 Tax=Streptomyces sp. KL118A TaxID=3045153 RepID=UPI00278C02D2|nr:caspase family protein [Streptomyces sp. KL118A]